MKFFLYLLVAVISFSVAFTIVDRLDNGSSVSDLIDSNIEIIEEIEENPYSSYYEQLNDNEKKMYAALLGLVAEGSGKVTFKDVNLKEFKEFMPSIGIAVQYDHPEYFWFTGGYTYSYKKGSEVCDITVEPIFYDYVTPFFNREEKLSELNKRVKQVALLEKEHSADDY